MKRRLVKKWINRYIKPLIKDLPRTEMCGWEIDNGDGTFEKFDGTNHTIKNGFVTPEGDIPLQGNGLRNNIKRTGEQVKRIIDTHKHVYLRVEPRIYGQRVYMRFITE